MDIIHGSLTVISRCQPCYPPGLQFISPRIVTIHGSHTTISDCLPKLLIYSLC